MSSRRRDRIDKPLLAAIAEIPYYLRVEIDRNQNAAEVHLFELCGEDYARWRPRLPTRPSACRDHSRFPSTPAIYWSRDRFALAGSSVPCGMMRHALAGAAMPTWEDVVSLAKSSAVLR